MSVGTVGGAMQSIDAVNNIMVAATAQTIEAAESMMEYTVATSVGAEIGKGGNVDVSA